MRFYSIGLNRLLRMVRLSLIVNVHRTSKITPYHRFCKWAATLKQNPDSSSLGSTARYVLGTNFKGVTLNEKQPHIWNTLSVLHLHFPF